MPAPWQQEPNTHLVHSLPYISISHAYQGLYHALIDAAGLPYLSPRRYERAPGVRALGVDGG